MSIEALILGKLHEPAKARTGNNSGRQFVTAKVRAPPIGWEIVCAPAVEAVPTQSASKRNSPVRIWRPTPVAPAS